MTDPKHHPRLAFEVALVSFAILFQELALIRWIPSQVRVAAYFPNIVLMSAFLGLGIGCIRSRSRLPYLVWPMSILVLCAATAAMSRVAFTNETESVHLWLLYFDLPGATVVRDIRLPIVALFVLCAATFVSPGHYLANRIREWTERGATLRGYAFDLLGSIAGIAAFAALSLSGTPPTLWFTVVAAATVILSRGHAWPARAGLAAVGALIVATVWVTSRDATFSPYYAISTGRMPGLSGPVVLTNGSLHQYPAPVAPVAGGARLTESDRRVRDGYAVPWLLLGRQPGRVLVLGAGTGNDVAAVLARGAKHVDAVEIDPVISDLGREMHPNHPYADPRVTVIHDDARSFLERTTDRYDFVVFGTLDSMTRLSALSTVRLDDFVYTREALAAARRLLEPGGGVVMHFMVGSRFIGERLIALHQDVFGTVPATIHQDYVMFNLIVLSGPAWDHAPRVLGTRYTWNPDAVLVPSDDWPFLYLSGRRIPRVYLDLILAIGAIGILATFTASRAMRRDAMSGRVDLEMLLLGAAFLLLETRAVTQMNLVWGATWITSAVVFASILVMLLLATLLMERRPISPRLSVLGLVLTLALSFAVPVSTIVGGSLATRLALTALAVGAPIFFASTLFAVRFASRSNTDAALGWNLLGAVLGGLLEFSSIVLGVRALALIALAFYLLASAAGSRRRDANTDLEPETAT